VSHRDVQDRRPFELEPYPAPVALDAFHPRLDQREARLGEGIGRKNGGLAPEVSARLARLPLGGLMALPELDIGRLSNEVTKPFTKQRRFEIPTRAVVDMRQGATVASFASAPTCRPTRPPLARTRASSSRRANTAKGSSARPPPPSSGVFSPISRTLRPSARRRVSPSTTRATSTCGRGPGAGQDA